MDAGPVRVAPSAEIDATLIDVSECCVERPRRREVLVYPGVEDHTGHPRIARDRLERLHQRTRGAAPSVRLLDVQVLDQRIAARFEHPSTSRSLCVPTPTNPIARP